MGELDQTGERGVADPDDHRHPAGHVLNDASGKCFRFPFGHFAGLAGHAQDRHSLHAEPAKEVDHLPGAVEIDAIVALEGRYRNDVDAPFVFADSWSGHCLGPHGQIT